MVDFGGDTPKKLGGCVGEGFIWGYREKRGVGDPGVGFGIALRWGRGLEGAQLELWGLPGGGAS